MLVGTRLWDISALGAFVEIDSQVTVAAGSTLVLTLFPYGEGRGLEVEELVVERSEAREGRGRGKEGEAATLARARRSAGGGSPRAPARPAPATSGSADTSRPRAAEPCRKAARTWRAF